MFVDLVFGRLNGKPITMRRAERWQLLRKFGSSFVDWHKTKLIQMTSEQYETLIA
jgi:hypothetical protein